MAKPNFVDLSHRLDEPAVRELLTLSAGYPTGEKLARIAQLYTDEPGRSVIGVEIDGTLAGLIGLLSGPERQVEILHLAVAPGQRGTGLSTLLLDEAIARNQAATISAETDVGAVGFYRRRGFSVESLGDECHGIERFRCTLALAPPSSDAR
jgi:ribosomal protein S18 acetylase RimI-like enzyme